MTDNPLELLLMKEIGLTVRMIERLRREQVKLQRRLERLRQKPRKGARCR